MENNIQAGGAPVETAQTPSESQVQESQLEGQESDSEQLEESPAVEAKIEAKKLKQLKLKVYGEEVSEDLPFEIDDNPAAVEYLTKQLQLAKAAQRAMQDNSSFQKQVQAFFTNLKGNTREALEQMGIDPKEFAQGVIEAEIKKMQMSPEEIERQELQGKVKKYEEDMRKREEEFKELELARLQEMHTEKLNTQITNAIDKANIPKTSHAIKRMADYMLAAANQGVDLSVDEIAPIVAQEIKDELREMVNALGEDAVEDFLGKDVFNRVRKKNLAKAKTPASIKSQIKDVTPAKTSAKPEVKASLKDFFKV